MRCYQLPGKHIRGEGNIGLENYTAYGDYIFTIIDYDKEKDLFTVEEVCRYIMVSNVFENIDTDDISIELEFKTTLTTKKIVVKRSDICKKDLSKLMDKGVNINDINALSVINFLNEAEISAHAQYVHSYLGWKFFNDKKVFRLNSCVGMDSKYIGSSDLVPKGTLAGWKQIIKDEVIGNTPMELMLVLGFSAMLVPLLKEYSGVDTLFAHLVNDSSKGKSSAEIVSLSPFGNPSLDGDLSKKWTATDNALVAFFNNNYGVPIILDESSASNKKDFTSFLYQACYGRDKDRLNKDCTLKPTAQWSTTIISSGESSLLSQSKPNTGLAIRLLELQGVTFTKSAENSDNIRIGLLNNYGHAAPLVAKYLMDISESSLATDFYKYKRSILDRIKTKNEFTDRKSNQYAIIGLTTEIVNKVLSLSLDCDAIIEFLVEIENKEMNRRNIGDKALQYFSEYFLMNQNLFYNDNISAVEGNIVGKFKNGNGYIEVSILKNRFEEIMSYGKFSDINVFLASWKKSGVLNCEADRFTRTRKIGVISKANVYVIKIKQ